MGMLMGYEASLLRIESESTKTLLVLTASL